MHRLKSALVGVVLGSMVSAAVFLLLPSLVSQLSSANRPPHAEAAVARAPLSASSTRMALVPILVYHIVRPAYPTDTASVKKYEVTPEVFDEELSYLQRSGYHSIGFKDLEAYFASSTPLPSKSVILSFDDAWSDQYQYAFPILEKYHDTATFFVFTNALGSKGFLTWQNLKTMLAAGMTIGDHSKSHPYFAHLMATSSLEREIVDTKRELETRLSTKVIAFAYPFGQYNRRVLEYVQKAGFLFGRGDGWHGPVVSPATRYTLSAMNAPTTIAEFEQRFP